MGTETVVEVLTRLGGLAGRRRLLAFVTRPQLEAAVVAGDVVRVSRGRYALPTAVVAQAEARRLTGTAILLSAAAHWGWETKWQPRRPQVAVPLGRRVPAAAREAADVRWRGIPAGDVVDGWVTCPLRTVVDCAVLLPFDEALAVADSALRSGRVQRQALVAAAGGVPVQHRRRVRRVAEHAVATAANPFESVLRAIVLDVPGLTVATQVRIEDWPASWAGWTSRTSGCGSSSRPRGWSSTASVSNGTETAPVTAD